MENTLPDVRSFTALMVGDQYRGRSFKVVKRFVNLKIPFKWNWIIHKCKSCNVIEQEIKTHIIHTVEIYELIKNHDDEQCDIQLWLAHTQDKKLLNIPVTRRPEILPHIKD